MNKLIILAVVCLLGSAAADTRFRRGILPGDSRYNGGNSGYSYNPPSSHHAPAANQPSRSYLQPETQSFSRQETRPGNTYLAPAPTQQRPQNTYLAPVKQAPAFEQIRSVEKHHYHEVSHQPAQSFNAPSFGPAPAPHKTYGAPSFNTPNFAGSAPAPVPHKTYGAPVVTANAAASAPAPVPHTTYGAPVVTSNTAASAPAPVPHTTYGAPVVSSNAAASAQVPAFPHKTYGTPVVTANAAASAPAPTIPHTSYGVPIPIPAPSAPVPHQTYGAPARQQEHHHHHHQVQTTYQHQESAAPAVHSAPAVQPIFVIQAHQLSAPQHSAQHHYAEHHEHEHEHEHEQEPLSPPSTAQHQQFREVNVHHETHTQHRQQNTYVPPAPSTEIEHDNIEANNQHDVSQPLGDNGGYVY